MSEAPGAGQDDALRAIYTVIDRLRWFLLAHALLLNWQRGADAAHPVALAIASMVMAAWTPVVGHCQRELRLRSTLVMTADMALSLALLMVSRSILGDELWRTSVVPMTGFWILAAPMASAVWRGARWGLGCALVMALARLLIGPAVDARGAGGLGVLVLMPWGLGAVVDSLRQSSQERDANRLRAAALAERDRLNRIVHDGALQVLALVEREGPELGPKGVYLANVARQQESRLRALLQDRTVELGDAETDAGSPTADVDLAALLERHDGESVTVSLMAGEVMMERHRAHELDAAVREVLANVGKHAGPSARAWVLLEEEDGIVTISVRDNGHGMTREQVATASASGRLGIQNSILGRVADVGGLAQARSQPGRGVEWEFRVPVRGEK